MRTVCYKLLAVLTAVSLVVPILARAEPNAFLNRSAYNRGALINQIQNDDVVMSRYTRHFGMTRQEVIAYFNTLTLDTTKEDGTYLVYNVPDTEEVRAKVVFYKKGTQVWVDRAGGLVLKASCGNPMTRGTDVQTVPITAEIEAEPNLVLRDMVMPLDTAIVLEFVTDDLPVDIETSALVFTTQPPLGVPEFISTSTVTSRFDPSILLPLGAIPFILIDGGGGTDPIPEPATVTLLSAGALALARKRRQNRSV